MVGLSHQHSIMLETAQLRDLRFASLVRFTQVEWLGTQMPKPRC